MKYRLLCSVLALAVACAGLPTLAFADQDQGATPQPVCVCDTLCAEGAVNTDCPLCRADLLACTGTDPGATTLPDQPGPDGPAAPSPSRAASSAPTPFPERISAAGRAA